MKRDPRLVRLSWDHHHGLVMARRIESELPGLDDAGVAAIYGDLVAFWAAGLLPHFRAEQECLLARLLRYRADAAPLIDRTHADHLAIEALVVAMRDSGSLEARRELLRGFGTALREHIRWEEDELFGRAQELLSEPEMAALGAQLDKELPPLAPAPLSRD